jgi:hypothetical protein
MFMQFKPLAVYVFASIVAVELVTGEKTSQIPFSFARTPSVTLSDTWLLLGPFQIGTRGS